MPSILALGKQHDDILALVERMSPLLKPEILARDAKPMAELLSKLNSKFLIHLAYQDHWLSPKLLAHPDPAVRDVAHRCSKEMGFLAAGLGAYCKRWMSATCIEHNAAAFVTETHLLFVALAKRIEQEHSELYPLAERAA
jgi:hypothetical protein